MIVYALESTLDPVEFRDLLIASTLGERRPVDDEERMRKMVAGANLVVTARVESKLVGVARSVTDYTYCIYLSDLAVDEGYQHQGIGKELIRQTKNAVPEGVLVLLAAPAAESYYPKIGMTRHEHCYLIRDVDELG